MKITFISDTHSKHRLIEKDLPGGDVLVHAGDIMNSGYDQEDLVDFCKWFDAIDNYDHKIFIAGNHDRMIENQPEKAMEIINSYKWITYLQDDWVICDGVKFYGTPWQPEFYNWAFNLKRGPQLEEKWAMIHDDTDVLITHGPPRGKLDFVKWDSFYAGCDDLKERVEIVKPKIHVFGHIHQGYGTIEENGTTYINASVLNEQYQYENKPITIEILNKNV